MSQASPSLDDLFARMRAAQRREPLPAWPLRARRLRALQALIRDNRPAIAAAIEADFGQRPADETDLLEVFPSLSALRHTLRHGRRWMRPRQRMAGFPFIPARTEVRPQPRGVVGIIVPWNYPLYLAAGPLIDALAAGNRVLLKMSEFTPAFSALFATLVAQYFEADEVAVVNGDVGVAQAFAGLPLDHLLFTGSTAVGRQVMQAAAAHLTPVTLELGGKSPAIVGPGARLAHAVERILLGKLVNAGQTCIAPDYVLLPRGQVQAFVELARRTTQRLYPDLGNNPSYTSIVSDRQYQRLAGLRDQALQAGAQTHALADDHDRPQARHLTPVLLSGVHDDMAVMQQEIFGPLLPLLPYDDLDEALAYVASHAHPLALYFFDQDQARIERVLSGSVAGGITVNDTLLHIAQHDLAFGGVGPSGMGGYHGEAGFRTFSHIKPVFRQARLNGSGLLNPPYGKRFRTMLELLLKRG